MDFETNDSGGWIVPEGTEIPNDTSIPACSVLGNGCTLGNGCRLGDNCKLEGVVANRWMTLANVDGSGRQILIVTDGESIKVRAGCFIGSPEEFALKARRERKYLYADIIPHAAKSMIKDIERGVS